LPVNAAAMYCHIRLSNFPIASDSP